jgi:conjugal transfer pilus assembly protein TraK
MHVNFASLVAAGALLVGVPFAALANPIPGLPVKTVGDSIELEFPETASTDRAATADSIPASKEAEALVAQIAGLRQSLPSGADGAGPSGAGLTPPPATIPVRPGVVEVIPIGLQRLNRIRTPFQHPDVKTVSETAMIEVEGSVIYVSTDTRDPISMFITERGQPDLALSVQLMPARIPQIETALEIPGASQAMVRAQPGVAQDWELDQPYVETLSELMSTLARQEVPRGYGMKVFGAEDGIHLPACAFPPGVRVRPAQILTGSNLIAVIAEVRNDSPFRVVLDESACAAPGVLAVAAYPLLTLERGQSTELYIARELPQLAPASQRRPVVVGGGR